MKTKLLSVLLNPFFIATILSCIIIYLLPNYNKKYQLELTDQSSIASNSRLYYEDLDGNGSSEKIVVRENVLGKASYMIYSQENELIDQWNFNSKFPTKLKNISFLDTNNDKFKEILNLTYSEDSIFINVIEPLKKDGIQRKNILVDTMTGFQGEYDLNDIYFETIASNKSYSKLVVFPVNIGFSGNPRRIYQYNPESNKIKKSPHLTNKSTISFTVDLNGDKSEEILLHTISACNHIDGNYTQKTDYSSWLTVLDDELDFLFPQLEFNIPYSSIKPLFPNKNDFIYLLGSKQKEYSSELLSVSKYGEIRNREKLNFNPHFTLFENNALYLYDYTNGSMYMYNTDFKEEQSFKLQKQSYIKRYDLDNNGKQEWVFLSQASGSLIIYDYKFNHSYNFSFPIQKDSPATIGVMTSEHNKNRPYLWLQNNEQIYFISFTENPFFYLKYFIYLGIYLGILGFVLVIMKIQTLREKQRIKLENQIAELQLRAVKNKIDPHFIFNAVNAFGEMTLAENKLEADKFIVEFSELMRKTLEGSDKITHSLKSELEYVKSYIRLQYMRFEKQFEYSIEVAPDINLDILVPRQVLFTYVENAIKHGMGQKERKLEIKIQVQRESTYLVLSVEDNAGGLGNSGIDKKLIAGQGLKIMEELFTLYTKLTKNKISHSFQNIYNTQDKLEGLRVEVKLDV